MTMLIKIVAKTNVKLISLYIVISSIITILTLTNDYYILYNGYKGLYLIGNWDQFLNFSHLIFVVLLTIPIVYFLTKSLQEKKHGLEQYPKAHKKKYYISVIRNSPKELFRRTCMGKVDRNHYFVALAIGCVALIVIIIISIVLIASIQVSMPTSAIKKTLQSVLAIMPIIALIQVIKMGIRRLRDAGKSSYYMLLLFVPIVGWIILTIMHCLPSQVDEENDFNKT